MLCYDRIVEQGVYYDRIIEQCVCCCVTTGLLSIVTVLRQDLLSSLCIVVMLQISKVAVEHCRQHTKCSDCLNDGDPYCGWCSLEKRRVLGCRSVLSSWLAALLPVPSSPSPVLSSSFHLLFPPSPSSKPSSSASSSLSSVHSSSVIVENRPNCPLNIVCGSRRKQSLV